MLDNDTKRRIDTARDILVGKVPDPKSQVEQITLALIYKFMDDMDLQSVGFGGIRSFFTGDYERYAWSRLFDASLGGFEMLNLYSEGLTKMSENPHLPLLFRNIFRNAYLPFRDAETLRLFLKTIHEFTYDHSERLGDAFEYLLSVLGSQGDAGQFRTPRHIIDFIVQVVAPQKHETVLDPACGTAGFLISAYKYILAQNATIDPKTKRPTDLLTIDEKNRLVQNFTGYDVSPDMVRLSQVNLYLHQFPDPKIFEYDTLSDEDRWNDTFDVILANPPFMTPKGFKSLNRRYRIQANRAEVLFVDYIAEHIHPVTGRAAIIVPEGIIFQSANVYQALRRMLVQEGYLWAVASLPAGVFQPYSGVKTSVLFLDRAAAKKSDRIHFVKIGADGFGLGAQRRAEEKNDLPAALDYLTRTREAILNGQTAPETTDADVLAVEKTAFGEDFNLSMDRYREGKAGIAKFEMVRLEGIIEFVSGLSLSIPDNISENGTPIFSMNNITENGELVLEGIRKIDIPKKSVNYLKKGDLLFNWRNGSQHLVGKTGYFNLEGEYVFASFLLGIRAKPEFLNSKFLWYILNFCRKEGKYLDFMRQSVNGLFNREELKIFEIPLPPLSHQKALVAQIEQWQKVADGARQIVQHYKPHIEVGEDWERVRLGEVAELVQYGLSLPMNTEGLGYKTFRMNELIDGKAFDNGEMKLSDISEKEFEKYRLEKGDLLFNRTNSFEHVGRTGIFDLEGDYCFASYLIRLRVNQTMANPFFVNLFMNTPEFQIGIKQYASRAIGQANINATSLKDYEIPLPHLPIQQQIVAAIERERAMVDSARGLIAAMEEKIKHLIGGLWERTETA